MTKDSVHLLFLGLTAFTAIVMPVAIFIVAPVWAGVAYVQDKVIDEYRS